MSTISEAPSLFESEVWRRLASADAFRSYGYILRRNASELICLLEAAESNAPSHLLPPLHSTFHGEVKRLLHNFVAAVGTLIDHTRVFHRTHYKVRGEFEDLIPEIDRRLGTPFHVFVPNLRNYVLHYRLPEHSTFVSGTSDPTRFHILLSVDELLKWDGWKAKARLHLNSVRSIHLKQVASEYLASVEDFHAWVLTRLDEIHAADRVEFERLRDVWANECHAPALAAYKSRFVATSETSATCDEE